MEGCLCVRSIQPLRSMWILEALESKVESKQRKQDTKKPLLQEIHTCSSRQMSLVFTCSVVYRKKQDLSRVVIINTAKEKTFPYFSIIEINGSKSGIQIKVFVSLMKTKHQQ